MVGCRFLVISIAVFRQESVKSKGGCYLKSLLSESTISVERCFSQVLWFYERVGAQGFNPFIFFGKMHGVHSLFEPLSSGFL